MKKFICDLFFGLVASIKFVHAKLAGVKVNAWVGAAVLSGATFAAFSYANSAGLEFFEPPSGTIDGKTRKAIANFIVFTLVAQALAACAIGYMMATNSPSKVNVLRPVNDFSFLTWFIFGVALGLWLLSYVFTTYVALVDPGWRPHFSELYAIQVEMRKPLPWLMTSVPIGAALGLLTNKHSPTTG